MPKRMILAAAAVALSTPAMATCIEGAGNAQCDVFLDQYRAMDVPTGTTMIWSDRAFLLEDFDRPGFGIGAGAFLGRDVLYWDGDDAFVVPGNSGPPIEITDW